MEELSATRLPFAVGPFVLIHLNQEGAQPLTFPTVPVLRIAMAGFGTGK